MTWPPAILATALVLSSVAFAAALVCLVWAADRIGDAFSMRTRGRLALVVVPLVALLWLSVYARAAGWFTS